MVMVKCKRVYAFRSNKVFAVNSYRLPLRAVHVADFIFELDDFGTLRSRKNRKYKDTHVYENMAAVIRHLERQGHYFNIEDGIPLVSETELEGKLLDAANDYCNRGCCSRACSELGTN
ncbi:hypothetical protein Aeh1gORF376c [Aeromonas phage Aeh1]|uniref:Uncharacterized protein n=1 Tax=Aeromonas phage Aeh1 TaxID=2880362 RepID=Q76YA2_9CAUD|nr:hypothetical protein Aeh1p343 [Aeromonas phage Aeh1]AAQ17993.1 hypothetical protein Aeh1gORF376c [Aeromonas phage Aeh1]